MHSPYQLRQERTALANWIAEDGYTHAITLNTDRELSSPRLKMIFSNFCHRFDKALHGGRNMKRMPTELRLRAIAFPENLSTNAHLHVSADFSTAVEFMGDEGSVMTLARTCWLQATRGAGSFYHEPAPDANWGRYCMKRFNGDYFLSSEFFPS